jgi:hypothetical protein
MNAAAGIGDFLGSPVWQGIGVLITMAAGVGALYLRLGTGRSVSRFKIRPRRTIRSFDLTQIGVAEKFYNELFRTIRAAKEQVYRSGPGFGSNRGDYFRRLLQAEEGALANGVEVVRVQTSPRAFDEWADGLASLLDHYPRQFRVFADFHRRAVPDFGLTDPHGTHPVVLLLFEWSEPAVSSVRSRPTAAVFLYGHRSLAAGLAEQFVARTQSLTPMASTDVRGLAKPQFYFAYGPHMVARHMQQYVPDAIRHGPATLRGWRLVLSTTPLPGSVSARIEHTEDPKDSVEGVVYELSEWSKKLLLNLEHGDHREVSVRAEQAETRFNAFAIVHDGPRIPEGQAARPTDLLLMIEGAGENRYGRLVERLRQFRAAVKQGNDSGA